MSSLRKRAQEEKAKRHNLLFRRTSLYEKGIKPIILRPSSGFFPFIADDTQGAYMIRYYPHTIQGAHQIPQYAVFALIYFIRRKAEMEGRFDTGRWILFGYSCLFC